jgi:CheY-like chemotaxis protein
MSQPSILIVEDETIIAADIAQKLDRLGYTVAGTAIRGDQAVKLARARHPDLVLMDIRLPGSVDGIQAADIIRRECDLPVIYLTAHSDRPTLERAKVTEPFGCILKPFEERELQSHIEMALCARTAWWR